MTAQLTPPPDGSLPDVPAPPVGRCPVTGTVPVTVGTGAPEVAPCADPREAVEFVRQHHTEQALPGVAERVREVLADIEATGTYTHSAAELAFGARVAWRNAARCVGRLPWSSLVVRDRRHLHTGPQVAADCVTHLGEAWNGGAVLPTISVFPAAAPGTTGPRVWNPQLIRYAGYRGADGTVVGDPAQADLTAHLEATYGWRGPGTRFDVLPLLVTGQDETVPTLLELPAEAVQEVEIRHPDLPGLADLGLRWHALPVIADQRLEVGGLWYPCAPFSGWYLADEIGARNLADVARYDLLPAVARALGLDTSPRDPYWRDLAQAQLTRAVHHSFKQARVTVADHHSEDRRLMSFARAATRRGEPVEVEWGWVVPPFGGSLTRAWHELYDAPAPDQRLRPAFVHQAGTQPPNPGPSHG